MSSHHKIRDLISGDKTEKAISEMYLLKSDNDNEISTLEAKFNSLKKVYSIGTISFQDYTQGMAQVNYGLLNILAQIPETVKVINPQIELLISKKSFLEKELILTYDAEKKFVIQQQIAEIERQIEKLK
jgi:hypothetical protein